MGTDAPERIWAVTEPDDISADILGEVYAQQIPDGMVGNPKKYILSDLIPALLAAERRKALEEAAKLYGDLYAIYGADRTDQFATGFLHGHDNHRAAIRALMEKETDDEV